jgi:truncated hemoglobin YjbI
VGGGHHDQGKGNSKDMRRFSQPPPVEQRAMDQWMQRTLKAQYTQTAEEPIPDELLALIRTFPQH